MESSFITSATRSAEYPRVRLPRIAFAGRSNVGKSTLINSLVGRKSLARTSSSPGRTRLINFFLVDGRWVFVDLPGYGYAKVSKAERENWGDMIEEYLTNDDLLEHLVLLVDSRHGPTELDQKMKEWLDDLDVPYFVVATKADKLSSTEIRKSIKRIEKAFEINQVIPYSARKGNGRKELWTAIQRGSSHE